MSDPQETGPLEYEPQIAPVRPERVSVRATMAGGCCALAGWTSFAVWYLWMWGSGGTFWWVAVPCLLCLVGSVCTVVAALYPPTWWATKVVVAALVILGLLLAGILMLAFAKLAAGLNWLIYI